MSLTSRLLLVLLLAGLAGCRAISPGGEAARVWAAGPVRWLLLDEELDRLQEVETTGDFTAFLQSFWGARDEDPSTPDNAFSDLFFRRVADADALYGEGRLRGSLSDRGGALLLLGPPKIMRHGHKTVPRMGGRNAPGTARPTERVTVEVWVYLTQDLSPNVQQAIREAWGPVPDLTLTFMLEGGRTRLVGGDDVLEVAARGLVRSEAVE